MTDSMKPMMYRLKDIDLTCLSMGEGMTLVPPWRLREDELYTKARLRVERSPRLRKYLSIILDDAWDSCARHLRWVLRGKVSEIELWAAEIKEGCDD